MRKIKFRAYDTIRNEYLSAGQIFLSINSGERPDDSVQYLDVISDPNKYTDRFIIEEFTGFYDSNGNEIYEGDILQLRGSGICEVSWNELVGAFCIRFSFETSFGIRPLGKWLECEKNVVVIGNIFDNSLKQ